jgi:hypothetical protein
MLQIAPEPIQPPHNQHIEPPPPRIRDQAVQRRTTVRGSADALVDVLGCCPAAGVGVSAQFLQLVLRFLLGGGNTGVDRAARTEDCTLTPLRLTRWSVKTGRGPVLVSRLLP